MSNTLSKIFSGAATWTLGLSGTYFRLLSAPAVVDVTFYRGNQPVASATGMDTGFFCKPDGGFDRVDIYSGTAQTVKVMLLDGDAGYDHFNVDISSAVSALAVTVSGTTSTTIAQSGTVTEATPVSVGTSATLLVAASAARKGIRFFNNGSVNVNIGGSGVTTANGVILLGPGMLWVETDAAPAAWYGVAGTAGQSVRIQELT